MLDTSQHTEKERIYTYIYIYIEAKAVHGSRVYAAKQYVFLFNLYGSSIRAKINLADFLSDILRVLRWLKSQFFEEMESVYKYTDRYIHKDIEMYSCQSNAFFKSVLATKLVATTLALVFQKTTSLI